MPELPEVETIAKQLRNVVVGKRIKSIDLLSKKSFVGDILSVIGKKILRVGRSAKVIEIELENSEVMLLVHLKMTGQLIYVDGDFRLVGGHPTSDWVNKLPSKHTRVVLNFETKGKLYFNDMRMFGWIKVVNKEDYLEKLNKKAPDVNTDGFNKEYFLRVTKKLRRPIKVLMLDQDLVGGVGNIYINDALYLASISPMRTVDNLSEFEVDSLILALKKVINLGIECGGASAANYVDLEGKGGSYQDHFLVYKKDGQLCKKCGEKILRVKMGGRGTFYCAVCQK